MTKKEFAEQVMAWLEAGYAITAQDGKGGLAADILVTQGYQVIQLNTYGIRSDWK